MQNLNSLFVLGTTLLWANTTAAQQLQLAATVPVAAGPLGVAAGPNAAYLANFGDNTLRVYDTSIPTAPVLRSSVSTTIQRARAVVSAGTIAYVTGYGTGLPTTHNIAAFNVSNPATPVLVRTVTLSGMPTNVAATTSLVCTISRPLTVGAASTLYIYDASLQELGTATLSDTPLALAVSGTTAYVLASNSTATIESLQVIDLSAPATPVVRATIPLGATNAGVSPRVLVRGTTVYTSNSLGTKIIDLSSLSAPVLTSTSDFLRALSGTYAVGFRTGNLQVFDIRNPAAPALVTSAPVTNSADAAASDGVIYTINSTGLQIFQYTPVLSNIRPSREAEYTIWPNPAAGDQVELALQASARSTEVVLLNGVGQELQRTTIAPGTVHYTLDISHLPAGLYMVGCNTSVQRFLRH